MDSQRVVVALGLAIFSCSTDKTNDKDAGVVSSTGGASTGGFSTGGTGGTSLGGASAGGSGGGLGGCPVMTWPPRDAGPEPTWPLDPALFDGGTFGCYDSLKPAPDGWIQNYSVPTCPGANSDCIYEPRFLPCGQCSDPGYICRMAVWTPLDCGKGPFLTQYSDGWFCKCSGGTWDCRDVGISGGEYQLCDQ